MTPDLEGGLTCNYLGNANGVYRACRRAKFSYKVCISNLPAHRYLHATNIVTTVGFSADLILPRSFERGHLRRRDTWVHTYCTNTYLGTFGDYVSAVNGQQS